MSAGADFARENADFGRRGDAMLAWAHEPICKCLTHYGERRDGNCAGTASLTPLPKHRLDLLQDEVLVWYCNGVLSCHIDAFVLDCTVLYCT